MESKADIGSPPHDESNEVERPYFHTLKQIPSGIQVCKTKNGNYILTASEGFVPKRILVEMTKKECKEFIRQLTEYVKDSPTDGETFPNRNPVG